MRKIKIMATLGPASGNLSIITDMVKAGADIIRLNFSHGSHEDMQRMIKIVRDVEVELDKPLPVVADLQGPTVRLGDFETVNVKTGSEVNFSLQGNGIPIPSGDSFKLAEKGDSLAFEGGMLWGVVIAKGTDTVTVRMEMDGELSSRKTVAIQGKEYDLPPLTEKDLDDLEFSVGQGIDGIALSFVKKGQDIRDLRGRLEALGSDAFIIAKVETISAVRNLEEIAEEADSIMIARGDLGSHFPQEKIPEIERTAINTALRVGKPSIVATQLLDSMIKNPMPTRAEIMDVFMAVSMGADGLLVTGETAVGKYPIRTVDWLNRISREAEGYSEFKPTFKATQTYDRFAEGVVKLADMIDGKLIAYTHTGKTPQRLGRFRPSGGLVGAATNIRICRRIALVWGVTPIFVPDLREENIEELIRISKRRGLLRKGNVAIVTRSLREGVTDAIRLFEIA